MLPKAQYRGTTLAALINQLIEAQVTNLYPRSEIVKAMAQAASIDPSTVLQIIRNEIICPPIQRLEAFSKVLGVPSWDLVNAAKQDGCMYQDES